MQELSPISQELIDAKYYWDRIDIAWFRLVKRSTMDVVGHCHPSAQGYTATVFDRDRWLQDVIPTPKRIPCASLGLAKLVIEQHAKDNWS